MRNASANQSVRLPIDVVSKPKYLMDRQAKTELARINRELKRLKTQMAGLEERRSKLLAGSRK